MYVCVYVCMYVYVCMCIYECGYISCMCVCSNPHTAELLGEANVFS